MTRFDEIVQSIFPDSDHLEHHGIKGMHWYVRRYQNYDGTRIGKAKRADGSDNPDSDPDVKGRVKAGYNSKTLQYKKSPQKLTDDELARRNKRMQAEVQYNQLRSQLQPKTKRQKRKELIRTIFIATATTAAAALVTQAYKKVGVWMVKKASGGKINLGGKSK